ncbi:MAG TPA: MBOAT family protein [Kiritimatiellia bacterium]|nr:MBOAT family protein [Kiritimatiellia bacterium]HMO98652.1 MBOAT family protein [Kiritimatiellia bacterium]HMP90847.1 MBOAT family protein [Kiritimatiellia bacterium]
MIFSSYEFIFLFLPLVLAGYYLLPARGRTLFLTLASYLFYGWWDYRFCGLMVLSTVIDFTAGKGLGRAHTTRGKKQWVALSVISNLALLGFFKYFDMFATTLNYGLATLFPASSIQHPVSIPLLHLVLPVGISFYTFQSMSYTIDLYKGRAKATRSFLDFACYVALFPQLVAGPIVRYHELAEQMAERTHTWGKASRGAALFVVGLAKKVLVADAVAPLTALAFDTAHPGFAAAWIGTLAYAMQIYFDFSGYSDMAVGLGLMFGFRFPINFNSPYQAVSITDFWRRWHISLSNWLRDYLYIPLGGNRLGPGRTYVNLLLVMLLGGLWHGANWTFVVWGAMHGGLLAWERCWNRATPRHAGWGRIRTFLLVCLAWVPFRAADLNQALAVWAGMTGLQGWGVVDWSTGLPLGFLVSALVMACLGAFCLPNSWRFFRVAEDEEVAPAFGSSTPQIVIRTAGVIVLFVVSIGVLMVNSSSPFLYFQF